MHSIVVFKLYFFKLEKEILDGEPRLWLICLTATVVVSIYFFANFAAKNNVFLIPVNR